MSNFLGEIKKIKEIVADEEQAETFIEGVYCLTNKNIKKTKNIINNEAWGHFYFDISSYSDLKSEFLSDEWDSDSIDSFKELMTLNDEDKVQAFFNNHGWFIASNGFAICLD